MKKVILTTGGTGGHVYPALAVAAKLRDRGIDVLFVGSLRMEKDLVTEAGYRFMGIDIKPPRRISSIIKYLLGIIRGFWIVLREKPDAIVGFGNYISVPCVLAGILQGRKVYLQEQNADMGMTNKLFYRFSQKLFLAFDGTYEDIPMKYQQKCVITGNPLRGEIEDIDIAAERDKMKIGPEEKVLVITGGSLGAKSINNGVIANWEAIIANKNLRLYWSTGENHYEEISRIIEKGKLSDTIKPYFNNMVNILAVADLVVCRAGALTLSEIIELGKPSILIPYGSVKVGQHKNAALLANEKAALVYNNSQASDAIKKALELIVDSKALQKMGHSVTQLRHENAADKIVDNLNLGE